MRKLVIVACLIVSICAYQKTKLSLGPTELTKIPAQYHLLQTILFPALQKKLQHVVSKLPVPIIKPASSGGEAILNDYADQIFGNLKNLMIEDGFDPLELPEIHQGFNYTLIITYSGELDLENGWLQDISTIHRGGDVVVFYTANDHFLEITVPIAFDDLQFSFDYTAKIMGLGPVGGLNGKISDLGIEVKIGLDTIALELSLDEFYITNSGTINVDFNGNPLVDWLLNLLTDVATTVLKEVILLVVEQVVRGGLDSAIETINEAINGILNPTTAAPATTVASLIFK